MQMTTKSDVMLFPTWLSTVFTIWKKTKVMRISRQPSPVTIMIEQKQLEDVECFKYLGSILTNDGRCTCEIKSRIAMAKAAFNKKKSLFTSKLDLNLRKKLVKCYIWKYGFVWRWNFDASGSRSEIPGKFWNVVLEKDGKDQLDRSCEKWRRVT